MNVYKRKKGKCEKRPKRKMSLMHNLFAFVILLEFLSNIDYLLEHKN